MKQLSVLVTGGAGFIGSNFVSYLLQSLPNVHVVVFDELTYAGNLENLLRVRDDPRFSFKQGDICDTRAIRDAMNDCNCVVHFAAETHVDRTAMATNRAIRTNVRGTLQLLEAAISLGIERFIHVSTAEVYGNLRPSSDYSFLENDPSNAFTPYALTKANAEQCVITYRDKGLPVIITRSTNNYGPYQYPEKQLPLFIVNALAGRSLPVYGDGQDSRDWIHVDDHCSALKAILTAEEKLVVGEIFNIGTGEERSILENAEAVLRLLGLGKERISFVPNRLVPVNRLSVNANKLRDRLDWIPRTCFEEGLAKTVAWYREHEKWLKNTLARDDQFLQQAMILGATNLYVD
jgi:dTDP-glucose 4,6-dehydratase